MMEVPQNLRTWFVIHFIVDYIVALPLFFAPRATLAFLGFDIVDPFATRLVAAALFGIGGASLLVRRKNADAFRSLLMVKIIWSMTAIIGMILAIFEGAPVFGYVAVVIFAVFSAVWIYYYRRFFRESSE